jgi:hypothetical protein
VRRLLRDRPAVRPVREALHAARTARWCTRS